MDTKKNNRSRIAVGMSLLGLILLVAVALPAGAARRPGAARGEPPRPAPAAAAALNGTYAGTVELDWALPGEFGDPLPTPTPDTEGPSPPDLGEIDLGLALIQSGDTVSGYVDLDFALVFTAEHTVDAAPFGPSVAGTFDGTDLTLTSERLSSVIAGQRLMRQFRLTGAMVPDQEDTLSGEYRETVWGYGSQPLTILGTFSLARVLLPESGLQVIKSVDTGGLSVLPLGGVVTYTLVINNSAGTVASSVVVSDTLPSAVSFGDQLEGAELLPLPDNTYQWGPYDVAAHTAYTVTFTAHITSDANFAGQTATNIANATAVDAGLVSDSASFTIESYIYLPLILKK